MKQARVKVVLRRLKGDLLKDYINICCYGVLFRVFCTSRQSFSPQFPGYVITPHTPKPVLTVRVCKKKVQKNAEEYLEEAKED